MDIESPLSDKLILVVDDEPDVLDVLADELDMCVLHRATDYDMAMDYMLKYDYDAVILDIMGVRGFDLLKNAVLRGFPALMITAHSLTPEALKKSIQLGAVSFLPKEKISELRPFLEDIVTYGGTPAWQRTFETVGGVFNKRFGPDWQTDEFFKEFMKEINKD